MYQVNLKNWRKRHFYEYSFIMSRFISPEIYEFRFTFVPPCQNSFLKRISIFNYQAYMCNLQISHI